jgi:hypothetical protein
VPLMVAIETICVYMSPYEALYKLRTVSSWPRHPASVGATNHG